MPELTKNYNLNIILLGFPDRSGLASLRSFGQLVRKPLIKIITDDKNNLAKNSVYNSNILYHSSLELDYSKATKSILGHLDCKKSLLIPTNDKYLNWLLLNYEILFSKHVIPYGDIENLEEIIDKWKIIKAAQSMDIDVPKSWYITNLNEIYNLKKDISYPCIIKPQLSISFKNNQLWKLQVEKANSFEELELYASLKLSQSNLLIQEYLIGYGCAANIAAIKGKISHYFQYERKHEPGFGGASSLRQSVKPNDDLLNKCSKIIQHFNYSGIGMLEFRLCDDRLYLMEFNARFWGSISLPVFCGLNFPKILYNQFSSGKMIEPKQTKSDYIIGLMARNLSSDIKWHYKKGILSTFYLLLVYPLKIIFRLVTKNEILDIERLSDPLPTFGHYKNIFSSLYNRCLMTLRSLRYYIFKYLFKYHFRKKINQVKDTHFICLGNINRSAFSEYYLKKKLKSKITQFGKQFNVSSSGLLMLEGRPSPPIAKKVANQFEINLDSHKSQSFYRRNIKDSNKTLVLTMDITQYFKLKSRLNKAIVIPLGLFSNGSINIPDPYKESEEKYILSFGKIKSSIDSLFDL